MYRFGYCRWCSIDKEDLRELKFEGFKVTCLQCGGQLLQMYSGIGPYFYLGLPEETDGRR